MIVAFVGGGLLLASDCISVFISLISGLSVLYILFFTSFFRLLGIGFVRGSSIWTRLWGNDVYLDILGVV